jgi:glycosyltransferase involved in cell wall biosynthesis
MLISVAITNHNQNSKVKECIALLNRQRLKPSTIFVLSDGRPFRCNDTNVVCINNARDIGRCENRNSVIQQFLKWEVDALVFLDGDCSPIGDSFIKEYAGLLKDNDLVFGTRIHTDVTGLKRPPSDLLTANMDNLYSGNALDYTDLRVASGAVRQWNESSSFDERLDLMLTGMIGWSCNFGITRKGLLQLLKFQKAHLGIKGIFDSGTFRNGWGYEDVAMGLDALYAGLKIGISDKIEVCHAAHERSDGLFDHVRGRHLIMDRYRKLEKSSKLKNLIYMAAILASAFYTAGLITGMVTETVTLLNSLGL